MVARKRGFLEMIASRTQMFMNSDLDVENWLPSHEIQSPHSDWQRESAPISKSL